MKLATTVEFEKEGSTLAARVLHLQRGRLLL